MIEGNRVRSQIRHLEPLRFTVRFDGYVLRSSNLEPNRLRPLINDRLDPDLLALLRGKRERAYQRHLRAAGRVRTLDGPRPQPRDDGKLLSHKVLQIIAVRAISAVILTFGYRCPIRRSASSRIHLP